MKFNGKIRIECNITQRCNARCDHCNKAVGYADGALKDMTLDQIRRAVDQLIDQKIMVKRFTFCGGEPILHPDLQEMIYEVARLVPYGLQWGRVLTNDLNQSKKLRSKIDLPRKFTWVPNPLDDPNDPLSGKNDPTKRGNKRFHLPFWISPHDVGIESKFDNCTTKGWCGIGLDAEGWSMCGKATLMGKLLGIDPTMKEGDLMKHFHTPIEDICKHCQYGVGGKRHRVGKKRGMRDDMVKIFEKWESGEIESISKTWEEAFSRHNDPTKEDLIQIEGF